MSDTPVATITVHFSDLEDLRVKGRTDHQLIDIIVIAICAVICGADGWVEVEEFGRAKEEWLKSFLDLPNGIPSHDTFGRVFAWLNPEHFQEGFMGWVQSVEKVTKGQVIAIDGKTVRRSHDRANGKGAIHMVSAWATKNRMTLGQRKVDAKSNEITAIPELLRVLDVSGCIVTIDAMGCQKEIAAQIVAQGGDYVLAVKKNQRKLHQRIEELFEYANEENYQAVEYDSVQTVDKGHGRIEIRHCWAISDPDYLFYAQDHINWPHLKTIVKVVGKRRNSGAETSETRYYVTSLGCNAKRLLQAIRRHWGIENSCHWILDVAFDEDRCRIRQGHGAQNFAVLRHIALNLLKREPYAKCGIKAKRLKAAWCERYLLKVLSV